VQQFSLSSRVEQPTKFDFVINLKTAKQIGADVPAERLSQSGQSNYYR
jgi:hypothetical protein